MHRHKIKTNKYALLLIRVKYYNQQTELLKKLEQPRKEARTGYISRIYMEIVIMRSRDTHLPIIRRIRKS